MHRQCGPSKRAMMMVGLHKTRKLPTPPKHVALNVLKRPTAVKAPHHLIALEEKLLPTQQKPVASNVPKRPTAVKALHPPRAVEGSATKVAKWLAGGEHKRRLFCSPQKEVPVITPKLKAVGLLSEAGKAPLKRIKGTHTTCEATPLAPKRLKISKDEPNKLPKRMLNFPQNGASMKHFEAENGPPSVNSELSDQDCVGVRNNLGTSNASSATAHFASQGMNHVLTNSSDLENIQIVCCDEAVNSEEQPRILNNNPDTSNASSATAHFANQGTNYVSTDRAGTSLDLNNIKIVFCGESVNAAELFSQECVGSRNNLGTSNASSATAHFASQGINHVSTDSSDLDNIPIIFVDEAVNSEEEPRILRSNLDTSNASSATAHFENHGNNDVLASEHPHVDQSHSHKKSRVIDNPVRKRKKNASQKVIRKKLKNAGQAYISHRGKEVLAREMRGPCACKFDCVHRVPEEKRQVIFKKFWSIGDHDKQWEYIRTHTTQKETKKRIDQTKSKSKNKTKQNRNKKKNHQNKKSKRKKRKNRENKKSNEKEMEKQGDDEENTTDTEVEMTPRKKQNDQSEPKRKVTRSYFFIIDGVQVKVCQFMFLSTLGICSSWVESAYSHINEEKGNIGTPDERGRHKKHPRKITQNMILNVKQHINIFPRVPSHYCRMRSRREYLQSGLSINKMARLYLKWAQEKGIPKIDTASRNIYRTILNENFNIGFFKPKKDQCNLCNLIKNKGNTRAVREKYKNFYAQHIKNHRRAQALKRSDKNAALKDRSIAICSFDLQKQLSCPKSESSCFFYRNKLNVFNFTVFNMIKREGRCYIWHEGMAKKGSAEIASSMFHFIKHLVKSGYKEMRFYSDNCGSQNKNRFIFAMFMTAAVLYNVKICHRFLEPGHTYMEVDSIHARIENATKHTEIFDFESWIKEIEDAKELKLKRSLIFNFKDLVSMQNWEMDSNGQKIRWTKVREVHLDGSEGNVLKLKYNYDEDFKTMRANKVGRPVNLKTYVPPLAYDRTIPLKAKTVSDLQWYCKTLAVPVNSHKFYEDVIAGVQPVEEDDESDVEYDSDEEICCGDRIAQDLEEAGQRSNGTDEESDKEDTDDESDEHEGSGVDEESDEEDADDGSDEGGSNDGSVENNFED